MTESQARRAVRDFRRNCGAPTRPFFCESCQAYHLQAKRNPIGIAHNDLPITLQTQQILELTAMGLTMSEVAQDLGISVYTVRYALDQAAYQFNALSVTNLLVIVTVLGLIDPFKFVAKATKGEACESVQSDTAGRESA